MTTARTATRRETRLETLERMAAKAHAEGLTLTAHQPREGGDARYFVASSRDRQRLYEVRPGDKVSGCECEGFGKHGYCKHYGLALEELGWLARYRPAPAAAPADFAQFCDVCGAGTDRPTEHTQRGQTLTLCAACAALPVCEMCGAETATRRLDNQDLCHRCEADYIAMFLADSK